MGSMEEKELKTSVKQRIFISLIAIIMVGTFVASYAAIVVGGSQSSSSSDTPEPLPEEKIAAYEQEYDEALEAFKAGTAGDFAVFRPYVAEVKAYNETAANNGGVVYRDLMTGGGRELAEGDSDYLAYYVGWCADESVFDSSLDNAATPTTFVKAIDASVGMIEGWNSGVIGMRLGGVREITIPGPLAYGEQMEICGGYNKPLKFLVMAVEKTGERADLIRALDTAYMKLQYANYGIDYDAEMGGK